MRIAADREVHWIVLTVRVVVESVAKVLINYFVRVLCGKGLYTAPALQVTVVATLQIACGAIDDFGASLAH